MRSLPAAHRVADRAGIFRDRLQLALRGIRAELSVRHNIPVLWDVDTRALVRHIRKMGALRGVVATDGTSAELLIAEARALPSMAGLELASRVTCRKAIRLGQGLD
jgi:carbamoylphosphate synthase small subunit